MKPSFLIVGLGNPGRGHLSTRHNAGRSAIDALAHEFGTGLWKPKQKFLADVCEARIVTVPVLLARPTTYMNDSGSAVRKLVDFFKLDPAHQLLILCDDIDLDLGELRIRPEGGAGTHNGLKSVVDRFGETFPRLRIGVRGPHAPKGSFQQAGEDLAAYVLSRPNAGEKEKLEGVIAKVPEAVREFVSHAAPRGRA